MPFNHGKTGRRTISQGEISAPDGAKPGKQALIDQVAGGEARRRPLSGGRYF